jgi:uncharacterized lipoprotein YddW (UPF0748 family)
MAHASVTSNANRYLKVRAALLASAAVALAGCGSIQHSTNSPSTGEVRATWITTTANTAVATPSDTAATMQRLRDIGLNTVYLEVWKEGYTQYPSNVLERTIGVSTHPSRQRDHRDLLQEMLIESHRNGLVAIAWFEYGFMAAHQSMMNELRRQKPEWLSRDINGSEVAPNGFVWMNPLHPEARNFLRDLVLEVVDRYDVDGIQFDDRIVWPYVTMGYDDVTRRAYAAEHNGAQPPADHNDPEWMRWRAQKVTEFATELTQAVRAKRPSLQLSLSPAVYPWSWEKYLLDWPAWARASNATSKTERVPSWDEYVPQVYRTNYSGFEKSWREQVQAMTQQGDHRPKLIAGIRVVGDGPDTSWLDLARSIQLSRESGAIGHSLWFSRGVLERYPGELKAFYQGSIPSPVFPVNWREKSLPLIRNAATRTWECPMMDEGKYRTIAFDGNQWRYLGGTKCQSSRAVMQRTYIFADDTDVGVELIRDRRESSRPRPR